MFRFFLSLALSLFVAMNCAHAAPRRRVTYSTPQRTYAYTGNSSGLTATAQGVAEIQARNCQMGHHGGNSGYEGVGSGSTPEEALGNCCYSNSGRMVVDQGVAQGRNGRWYACKRYR